MLGHARVPQGDVPRRLAHQGGAGIQRRVVAGRLGRRGEGVQQIAILAAPAAAQAHGMQRRAARCGSAQGRDRHPERLAVEPLQALLHARGRPGLMIGQPALGLARPLIEQMPRQAPLRQRAAQGRRPPLRRAALMDEQFGKHSIFPLHQDYRTAHPQFSQMTQIKKPPLRSIAARVTWEQTFSARWIASNADRSDGIGSAPAAPKLRCSDTFVTETGQAVEFVSSAQSAVRSCSIRYFLRNCSIWPRR